MENKVRLNIRTATSTRPRGSSILVQEDNIIPLFLMSFSIDNNFDNIFNDVLLSSFEQKSELERDDTVQPDIRCKKIEEKDDEKSCVICMNGFKKGERCTELLCGHHFHVECVSEWCKYKSKCPVCRSEIPVKK